MGARYRRVVYCLAAAPGADACCSIFTRARRSPPLPRQRSPFPPRQRSATMLRRLIEVAAGSRSDSPPTPLSASRAHELASYAILPRQKEEELALARVHSRLDRALRFLQREVGYSLLDDLRTQPGGGATLGKGTSSAARQKPGVPTMPRAPKGRDSSFRIPKEEVGKTPIGEAREPEHTLDDRVVVFSADTARNAQYPEDIDLVWRFTNILAEASPNAMRMVKQELLYKTVLKSISLLHRCDYHYSDVVVTLAHASVYFRTVFANVGHRMNDYEAAHVTVLLIYLAHSFVLDETCPLRCWHRLIFNRYCTFKVLDAALFRLFRLRDYGLRISLEEEKHALSALLTRDDTYVLAGGTRLRLQRDSGR